MFFFRFKNNDPDFIQMENFSNYLKSLLAEDSFISRKMINDEYSECDKSYSNLENLKKNDLLHEWAKKRKCSYNSIVQYMDEYFDVLSIIKQHNDKYVEKHLVCDKEYLDSILKEDNPNILLDNDQRTVILRDEDNTLVVAGAGSGKTTTIEAKTKYLVEKKHIKPEDILIVSFTRKATQELKDRINKKLKIPAIISTFHSVGYTLIKRNANENYEVDFQNSMWLVVRKYLIDASKNEDFLNKLLLFFASYLRTPYNDQDKNTLFKHLENDNPNTLKSEIDNFVKNEKNNYAKSKLTLKNEKVRSYQEAKIANYLFINGIDYEYESPYEFSLHNSLKVYTPDFTIKQGNKVFYLEHFGVTENGENNRYSKEELIRYNEEIKDKKLHHEKHKTILITTYSKYNDGRDLLVHLKDELQKNGIVLDRRNNKEIFDILIKQSKNKYFNDFIKLITTFIQRFKTNNFSDDKFQEWQDAIDKRDVRTRLFLEIAKGCYFNYEKFLKDNNKIDFEDMINYAADVLDTFENNHQKLQFKYIFVDEYQDISMQRFDLCEKLSKVSDAKIIAVGDDWQSIYRFSGSKISLFTNFIEKMPNAEILEITNTYRNSQELINIAGSFIMKNNQQFKKTLKSPKRLEDPILIYSYDDSYEKDEDDHGLSYRLGNTINKAIEDIVSKFGPKTSILLIGRYNFDFSNLLSYCPDFFTGSLKNFKAVNFPDVSIDILTAHSSKDLTYKNVIIINARDEIYGFPSKIQDDPIMKLVITDSDEFEYAEERRLFYVSLTRTENRVYIITPEHKASKFVLELMENFTTIKVKGNIPNKSNDLYIENKCPICGYPLQYRKSKIYDNNGRALSLYICSNDPEICGFMTNDVMGGKMAITKCKKCKSGYLIVKPVKKHQNEDKTEYILGCTNYRKDGTGCDNIMRPEEYELIGQKKIKDEITNEDGSTEFLYHDFDLKEIVNDILAIIDNAEKKKNFKFNSHSLTDFLKGRSNTNINAFKLENSDDYGKYSNLADNEIHKILTSILDTGLISSDEKMYNYLSPNAKFVDDENLSKIYKKI